MDDSFLEINQLTYYLHNYLTEINIDKIIIEYYYQLYLSNEKYDITFFENNYTNKKIMKNNCIIKLLINNINNLECEDNNRWRPIHYLCRFSTHHEL